ncbi:MAG TPA: hypothetical protein EYG81_02410 [Archaeoglobus profundus]|nr:hypothetical protein [Archaeoglobus profundus]
MVKFRSTKEFEWNTFKRFELKKFIFIYVIFLIPFIFFLHKLIRTLDFPYNLGWILYGVWIGVIYPALLIFVRLKPKTYEITSRGIRIDGNMICWKNFKEVIEYGDYIILKGRYTRSIILPKYLKNHITYYVKAKDYS